MMIDYNHKNDNQINHNNNPNDDNKINHNHNNFSKLKKEKSANRKI